MILDSGLLFWGHGHVCRAFRTGGVACSYTYQALYDVEVNLILFLVLLVRVNVLLFVRRLMFVFCVPYTRYYDQINKNKENCIEYLMQRIFCVCVVADIWCCRRENSSAFRHRLSRSPLRRLRCGPVLHRTLWLVDRCAAKSNGVYSRHGSVLRRTPETAGGLSHSIGWCFMIYITSIAIFAVLYFVRHLEAIHHSRVGCCCFIFSHIGCSEKSNPLRFFQCYRQSLGMSKQNFTDIL